MIRSYKLFWKNILTINTKSNRRDYWVPLIVNVIIGSLLVGFIELFLGHPIETIYSWHDLTIASVRNLVVFVTWIASLTVKIRRLHDTNRSGWWLLIELIPIIGTIWFFILMILPGRTNTRWD
jgi:uncharacterized membrane protein YhaH (DUF805 family)